MLGDFPWNRKIISCQKIITKIFTVRKTVKMSILSPVATLEMHEREGAAATNCYKNKSKTIQVELKGFRTTQTVTTTPPISVFTLSHPKNRDLFWVDPKVCFRNSQPWKKISTNNFHHSKLHPKQGLILIYEQNRTKLSEKLSRTKGAVKKLLKWVQLNFILSDPHNRKCW